MASPDGEKVHDQIAAAFREGKKVILSFQNAEDISSAFLHEAIAQLYADFPSEQIESSLSIIDIEPDDAADLKYTVQDMKEYLEDPQRFINATIEVLGEDYL